MNAFKSRVSAALQLCALALVVHACTTPSIEDVIVRPTSMSATGSTTLTAGAGATLTSPAQVKVLDQGGLPLPNRQVAFAASAGTLSSATANTNDQGLASPASWTAPTVAGNATITASVPGAASVPSVTFNVTVNAGPPATQTKTASTDNLSAVAGSATASAPEVNVVDQYGNGISGVVVTFTIQTGGGTLNGSSLTTTTVTTSSTGKAKLTSWVLGGTIGSNTVRATTTVLAGQPLTFTATGTVGPPNKIEIAPPGNSQAQTATAGSNVAVAPAVVVKDVNNNVLNNVGVRFAINVGGGKLISSTGTQVIQVDVTTNAQGIATSFGWMVWDLGTNSLTVTVTTTSGVTPFQITATSLAGPPTQIAVVTETPSSNNQTAPALTTVAVAPGAVLKDANGFPVANTSVTFTVGANSGVIKLTSGGAELTTFGLNTDANGIARVFSWKLGPNKGANTLTAELTGTPGINTTFTATGIAGPPASIAIENPGTMNNQTTIANTAVGVAPAVVVRDANNLTVDAGVSVTFLITQGGGVVSATGCTGSAINTVVTTNSSGIATLGCWKPGAVGSNANTLRAQITGSPSIFVLFTATGTVGPATTIAFTNQPWPFTRATFNNGGEPMVKVSDAGGNGVSGVTVNWSNGGDTDGVVGGTLTSITNASGIATFLRTQGGTWTAANVASGAIMNLQASVVSPSLSATTNSVVVTAPASFTAAATPTATTTVNTNATPEARLVVRDASNRPVPGVALTWSYPSNPNANGTLNAPATATDSVGEAGSGAWRVSQTAGVNTIRADVAAPAIFTTFSTTGIAGAASQITINAGNGQNAPVGTAVATPPAVLVRDQFNNPVSTVGVTFSPTSGSGSVTGSPANTNASGIATVGSWTLGTTAGAMTLNAFVTSIPAVTVAISATATDPCANPTPHTIGQAAVNGTVASTDCNVSDAGIFYTDLVRITVPAATTRFFSATLTTPVMTPALRSFLYGGGANGAHWISSGSGAGTITRYYVVGPGNADIGVTSTTTTTSGAYTFSTALNPVMPAANCVVLVTKAITITHTLSTSCLYAHKSGTNQTSQVSSRSYLIYLPAGQSLTVRMNEFGGNGLDSYLEAYENGTTNLIAFDDDGGAVGVDALMTIASSGINRYIEIVASHHTIQAQNSNSFTLIIDP